MRRVDDMIFSAFDFPDCGQVQGKRPVSTTPLQALNLMNSPFVVEQSKLIAKRAATPQSPNESPETAIIRCYQMVLQRNPSDAELLLASSISQNHGLHIVARSLINSNEFVFLP